METSIDNPQKFYAGFANASYKSDDMSHLGYKIDTELSNRNRTLYHNPETNHAIFSFRGTDLKGKSKFGDIGRDALLAVGLKHLSSRFRNASKYTKLAQEKYGDNLVLTGHSLGASTALHTNTKHGVGETLTTQGLVLIWLKKASRRSCLTN